MLTVGIIGLPNVGKSTVFNALAGAHARVSDFPFCTIEPNKAVVAVPDPRLARLGELSQQERVVPAATEFVDIAGLVRGASKGEGLGNQFLGHVRTVDALLHVLRGFPNEAIPHVEGGMDPVRDASIVDLELALADLAIVQRRLERLEGGVRRREKDAMAEAEVLNRVAKELDAARPLRLLPLDEHQRQVVREAGLLTEKPVLYLLNAADRDDEQARAALAALEPYVREHGGRVDALGGKLEADLADITEGEREEFKKELGLPESGLERVIRQCYEMLGLLTFFTIVGQEARAWAMPRGGTALKAAGMIHSDMEKGFIKAEVLDFGTLERLGSWQEARNQGLVRIEGHDYHLADGDILRIRFHA